MIKSNLSFAQQKEKLINEKTEQVKKLIPESIKLYKMVEKGNVKFHEKKILMATFNFTEFFFYFQ